jgi:hypothetical protein
LLELAEDEVVLGRPLTASNRGKGNLEPRAEAFDF